MSIEDDPGHAAYLAAIATPTLPERPAPDVPESAAESGAGSLPVVLSAEDVGWMMRSIRDAQSRIQEETVTHNNYRSKLLLEMDLIDEAEHAATKPDIDRIAYLTQQLEAHLLNKRAADPEVKSIATPWGTVSSRVQQPEYKRDDAVLREWAFANGYWRQQTKVIEEIHWDALKKACHVNTLGQLVTDQGEIVPGVEVITRGPKVTVEVTP